MLAAVRSELTRLRQPRLLVTWFGFPRKQQELELEAEYAKET